MSEKMRHEGTPRFSHRAPLQQEERNRMIHVGGEPPERRGVVILKVASGVLCCCWRGAPQISANKKAVRKQDRGITSRRGSRERLRCLPWRHTACAIRKAVMMLRAPHTVTLARCATTAAQKEGGEAQQARRARQRYAGSDEGSDAAPVFFPPSACCLSPASARVAAVR